MLPHATVSFFGWIVFVYFLSLGSVVLKLYHPHLLTIQVAEVAIFMIL